MLEAPRNSPKAAAPLGGWQQAVDSKVIPTLTGCFILARYRERGDLQGSCGHNRVGGCPQCSAAFTAAELSIASRRVRGRGKGIGDREKSDQGTEML